MRDGGQCGGFKTLELLAVITHLHLHSLQLEASPRGISWGVFQSYFYFRKVFAQKRVMTGKNSSVFESPMSILPYGWGVSSAPISCDVTLRYYAMLLLLLFLFNFIFKNLKLFKNYFKII